MGERHYGDPCEKYVHHKVLRSALHRNTYRRGGCTTASEKEPPLSSGGGGAGFGLASRNLSSPYSPTAALMAVWTGTARPPRAPSFLARLGVTFQNRDGDREDLLAHTPTPTRQVKMQNWKLRKLSVLGSRGSREILDWTWSRARRLLRWHALTRHRCSLSRHPQDSPVSAETSRCEF